VQLVAMTPVAQCPKSRQLFKKECTSYSGNENWKWNAILASWPTNSNMLRYFINSFHRSIHRDQRYEPNRQ